MLYFISVYCTDLESDKSVNDFCCSVTSVILAMVQFDRLTFILKSKGICLCLWLTDLINGTVLQTDLFE